MWSKEEAQKLLAEFERTVNAIPAGISGKTGVNRKASVKTLYDTVVNHGLKLTRKEGGGRGVGGGYILQELIKMAQQDEIDEDDIDDLEDFVSDMERFMAKKSTLNPANIVFNGVIGFKKLKGGKRKVERGKVWGHFLTPAYHAFRKEKAERNNETYDMPAPDPKWTSLKDDGSARPPLWEALFGEGGLKDLVDAFIELAEPVDLPPTPEVEVANVRRKRGNLAEVPAVRRMVEEILQDKSLYVKNTNTPVKSRLKEAFNSKTIAVTEEDMKMIGPLVFVKVDGQDVRLSEIPGYLERRSIGLNFTNIMLRELIREVLGEREKTYETPYHKEGKVKSRGLVLKAVEARKNLLKALADIDPSDKPYYDNLQDIIDACRTQDMEEYIPALELITLEMGRTLNVRVIPMVVSTPTQREDITIDISKLTPSYYMYLQSNEMNMTAPVLYAINPNIKVFRTQEELRPGGQNITPNNLMQVVRGLIA
tara:strand:+ start:17645 stop:19087 length:1443 start_codon:yes stop_codon:yes gene_type:complete